MYILKLWNKPELGLEVDRWPLFYTEEEDCDPSF